MAALGRGPEGSGVASSLANRATERYKKRVRAQAADNAALRQEVKHLRARLVHEPRSQRRSTSMPE